MTNIAEHIANFSDEEMNTKAFDFIYHSEDDFLNEAFADYNADCVNLYQCALAFFTDMIETHKCNAAQREKILTFASHVARYAIEFELAERNAA